jgi:hypothetical protein
VLNVLPIANGYGPFEKLVAFSNALPSGEPCRGATFARTTAGVFKIYAADRTTIYELNTTTLNWADVSRAGNYTAIPSGDSWDFQQFGDKLVATQSNDVVQVVDVDSGGNFANLAGSPPQAKYVWIAGEYLVLGHLSGFPARIQWSGLNDIELWTAGLASGKGSDYQDLPDGNEVMGGMEAIGGGRIIQRDARRLMTVAPTTGRTFRISPIDANRGSVAPGSIVEIGSNDYVFLAEDGFYRGDQYIPIGAERVNRYFFADVDLGLLGETQGAADPLNKMVWWRYKDGAGVSKMIGYDWQIDRWTRSDAAPDLLVSAVTPGYSIDGLASFGNIDTIQYSLDSRVFKGGRPTFAAFTSDYKLAFFNGSNQQATLETEDLQPASGKRTLCNGYRTIGDADDITGKHAVAKYHGQTRTWGADRTAHPESGIFPTLASGRVHRFRTTIAEGDVWGHMHGVEPDDLTVEGEA